MKKIKTLSMILAVLFISSCAEFLDVNHDPNNPEESTPALVFPAGVENTAAVVGGPWQILGGIWSQHWTSEPNAPQYQGEDRYEVQAGDYNYDLYGWEYLYTRALMDYEWVRETARAEENWTYYLMANVMQAYTYQVMVDFFDQIPFTEALQKVPGRFDSGEIVYDSLIARIDDALAKDLSAPTAQDPKAGDVVFGGNMSNWVAFANTLKLKIYMRQRFARPDVAQTGITAMYNNEAPFLTTDAAFADFADESGRDNYCYASEFRGGSINICASKTILDFMEDENDPRIGYMFTEGTSGFQGMYQGDIRNNYSYLTEPAKFSKPTVTALQPVYFISAVESYLLQAEAALVYGVGNAEALYQQAIIVDFERKKVAEEDGSPEDVFVAFTDDEEANLETIIVEKWVALANSQSVETFFEHNRTGYPRESTARLNDEDFDANYTEGEFVVSATGVLPNSNPFPKRLLLPSSEESKNPNFPGREPLYTPVWWDVRDYPY